MLGLYKGRFIALLAASLICSLHAAVAQTTPAGTVVEVSGRVELNTQQVSAWQAASVNDALNSGDEIQTWEGKSTLLLADESMLKLNRNTYMRMQDVSQAASWRRPTGILNAASPTLKSIYRLFKGDAWLRNNNRGVDIEVETPTVTASLRGTELHIEVVSPELVNITVLEGAVLASNAVGSVEAYAGELIIAPLGQAPRKQTLLTPEDSVQWTVRVPNLLREQDLAFAGASSAEQQAIRSVFTDLNSQNIRAAEQRVQSLENTDGAARPVLNALVDMAAGNYQKAKLAFAQASQQPTNNKVALRGLAISSLLTNEKEQAMIAAEQAVASDPTVTDWLVLSYIQRANFDLPSAEASAQAALALEPNNIVALTNLGLLEFADDRVDQARQTIEKALQVDGQDSIAHTLLGFVQLSERDQQGADASFSSALQLDPSNSEAYLGASLLAQRLGQTQVAQKRLATAIALEPQRSLFLSYWAKALHAEQRFDKALTVLDSAARLDDQDPTPHYYRSIIERDLFRAGEAINSLQKAIDLNDKRAVYRSRLLLDQDLATRNIDLATIYGALGMNLLATQKAVQSTLDDARNFSAHLFLSSALSEAGRTFPAGSEILVSGLMLPANANSLSSINDYSAFFEGPEFDSGITVLAGSDDTVGVTATIAGVVPEQDFSYGILASAGESDGFNGDNGGDAKSLSGTLKWQASQKDSFRLRLSLNDNEQLNGAVIPISATSFVTDIIAENTDSLIDFGYRRELSNRSDFLLNLVYRETNFDTQQQVLTDQGVEDILFVFDTLEGRQRDTLQVQGQYSIDLGEHYLSTGVVYLDGEQTTDFNRTTSLLSSDGFFLDIPEELQQQLDLDDNIAKQAGDSQRDQQFVSVYADNVWTVSQNLTLHTGLYYEDFDNETTNEAELNPRLAAVWKPTPQDTLRLAGFRYLLPQVQARLHPTHVGGVFITRNTEEGVLVEELNMIWERNWEGGIFSANLFDLERENREINALSSLETLSRDSLRGASFAVNQLMGQRFGVAANIEFTEFRADSEIIQTPRDEINASVTLSYVSPRRITASIVQRFRDIDFQNPNRGDEDFPITDASLSYTFKGRKGGVALTVSNLFDKEFIGFTDTFSFANAVPARQITGTFSWNF